MTIAQLRVSAIRTSGRAALFALLTVFGVACSASDTIVSVSDVVDSLTIVADSLSVDQRFVPVSEVTIEEGGTLKVSAIATNALGQGIGAVAVTWSSDATGVATVSGDGVITGVAVGTTQVFASAQGEFTSVEVRVLAGVQPPAPPPA